MEGCSKLAKMKTLSILETIQTLNYWIKKSGLPEKSESYFSNWGLCLNGDLFSEIKLWADDYISEQHSIKCEK